MYAFFSTDFFRALVSNSFAALFGVFTALRIQTWLEHRRQSDHRFQLLHALRDDLTRNLNIIKQIENEVERNPVETANVNIV
jgi:hypothetical protein